jgi:hypothetical protein
MIELKPIKDTWLLYLLYFCVGCVVGTFFAIDRQDKKWEAMLIEQRLGSYTADGVFVPRWLEPIVIGNDTIR